MDGKNRSKYGERADDKADGLKARFFAWHAQWATVFQLVMGVITVMCAIGLCVLAGFFYLAEADRNDRNADSARLTRNQCLRSIRLYAPNLKEHIKAGIYTKSDLDFYRSTRPKGC